MKYSIALFIFLFIVACSAEKTDKKADFPYMGRKKVETKMVDGKQVEKKVNHKIPDFKLRNQDSTWITNDSLKGKVYVADFFFTSCPTICPTMKKQMLRVYNEFDDNSSVRIVSHTIDPEYDTIPLLKQFAADLGVKAPKWSFLTGEKQEIYELGQTGYMVTALEDEDAEGGYIHSGAFVLVDKEGHIRGVYDGTKEEEVSRLIEDIPLLLATYETES